MTSPRRVISIQPGQPASDGAGVRLNRVIGGPGSFVIAAQTFADFGEAIQRKLILEIAGRDLSRVG